MILRRLQSLKPVIEDNILKGRVIFIDTYGNVVTNITKVDFDRMRKDRDFVIMFIKASLDIRKNKHNLHGCL